nr:hypothetical protein [Bacilli bacterium]
MTKKHETQENRYRAVDTVSGKLPSMDFYLVQQNGVTLEACDPLTLYVQATKEQVDDMTFSDVLTVGLEQMWRESQRLAMLGTYSKVYSAIGLLYDPDSRHCTWENHDDALILDAFSPFTVLQSFIKSEKYRIFEKVPHLTQPKENLVLGCQGCKYHEPATSTCSQFLANNTKKNPCLGCQFRVPDDVTYDDYVEVTEANMTDPSGYKEWLPFDERLQEYENARRNWTDSKQ